MTNTKNANVTRFHLTPKQERIAVGAGRLVEDGSEAKRITYSHSVLCQTSLPFKDQSATREWKNQNGRSIVLIEAGQVYDPNKTDMAKLGLPYGTKPRLILLDWNRQAILTQSPEIEVEDTLYAFLHRLKLPTEGRVYSMIKKQLAALAACQMTIGWTEDNGSGSTGYGRIVSNMNVLFSKNEKQRILWPNTVTLSTDYFNSLMHHAVPLNEVRYTCCGTVQWNSTCTQCFPNGCIVSPKASRSSFRGHPFTINTEKATSAYGTSELGF